MDEYRLFLDFEKGMNINKSDLLKVTNYVNYVWSPNRSYSECQYNYLTKLKVVCIWKRKRGLPCCSKKVKQYAMIN